MAVAELRSNTRYGMMCLPGKSCRSTVPVRFRVSKLCSLNPSGATGLAKEGIALK